MAHGDRAQSVRSNLAAKLDFFRSLYSAAVRNHFQWGCGLFALLLLFVATGNSQEKSTRSPLIISSVSPHGMTAFTNNRWGAIRCQVINPTDQDRYVRASTYESRNQSDQYGRIFWVPANSVTNVWFPFFPSNFEKAGSPFSEVVTKLDEVEVDDKPRALTTETIDKPLEVSAWLTDITDGQELHIPTATGEMHFSTQIQWSPREHRTALVHDTVPGSFQTDVEYDYELMVTFRVDGRGLSRRTTDTIAGELVADSECLKSFDSIQIAGNEFARDTALVDALRGWLVSGGRLWILADKTSPETIDALLGDFVSVEVVNEVELNDYTLTTESPSGFVAGELLSEDVSLEEPVRMLRVKAPGTEPVAFVDGWPVVFWKKVGNGEVMFTTMESRGLQRRRAPSDQPTGARALQQTSPGNFDSHTSHFVGRKAFLSQAARFFDSAQPLQIPQRVQAEFLSQAVGYELAPRSLIFSVLAVFVIGLLVPSYFFAVRQKPHFLLAWIPVWAIICLVTLALIGRATRHSLEPMQVGFQFAQAFPGSDLVHMESGYQIYTPDSTPKKILAEDVGVVALERPDSISDIREMLWKDLGGWEVDGVKLPGGISQATNATQKTLTQPLSARAIFGPQGVEGALQLSSFTEPQFGLAIWERNFGEVTFDGNTKFKIAAGTKLPPGKTSTKEFVDSSHRARNAVYEKTFFEKNGWELSEPTLLCWTKSLPAKLQVGEVANTRGEALVSVPITFERTAPGTEVSIPGAFVRTRASADIEGTENSLAYSYRTGEWLSNELPTAATVYLRFKIPESVLPLKLDRADFSFAIDAKDRDVEIMTVRDGKDFAIQSYKNSTDARSIVFDDPSDLAVTASGEWVVGIRVSSVPDLVSRTPWRITKADVHFHGKTLSQE